MTQYIVVGLFPRFGDAERTIQDLELAGIVGEQVEVIGDIDEDVRTESTPGERTTNPPESYHSKIARLFHGASEADVRDEAGELPDYIGEQQFYTSHVKEGHAVLVIRTPTEAAANRAATILKDHGAHTPRQKSVTVRRIES
ncbi:MAG: hypothetical protein ACRD40_03905 [Candidatus Acidiferrales bacterium]